MPDRVLDVRDLRCPLPVLKTARALRDVGVGATLRVLATDPLAPQDFADFCRTSGNILLESTAQDGFMAFLIRREG